MSIGLTYAPAILDSGDVLWTAGSNVTATIETTTIKTGTGSVKLSIDTGAGVQVVGYRNFNHAVDLSGCGATATVSFWCRSTVSLSSSDFFVRLSTTTNGSTGTHDFNCGAVTANTWTQVTITGIDFTSSTALLSIAVYQAVDKGVMIFYLDDVQITTTNAKTFTNELNVTGFDNPEMTEAHPKKNITRLLNGNLHRTRPRVTTRDIRFDIVVQSAAEMQFIFDFWNADTQRLTYNSETIDVVSTEDEFPASRVQGLRHAQIVRMNVKEKTARAIGNVPSSW